MPRLRQIVGSAILHACEDDEVPLGNKCVCIAGVELFMPTGVYLKFIQALIATCLFIEYSTFGVSVCPVRCVQAHGYRSERAGACPGLELAPRVGDRPIFDDMYYMFCMLI